MKYVRYLMIVVSMVGGSLLYGQGAPATTPVAKCIVPFVMTTTGSHAPSVLGFDNRTEGCTNWTITYSSFGFTVVSLLVESAPMGSTTVAGTFVSWAGTVSSGANPNTATTQNTSNFTGYYPWVRITGTFTGVGRVQGVLIGEAPIDANAGGGGGGGGCANPCPVIGVEADGAPVTNATVGIGGKDGSGNKQDIIVDTAGRIDPSGTSTAGADGISNTQINPTAGGVASVQRVVPYLFNGATNDRELVCTNQALFNLSGSGNTEIVALSGSTTIRICHISMSTTASEDIKITRGTGTNCGTGTADVTGLYKSVLALAFDFSPKSPLKGAASGAICVNQSATQATGGVVVYAQF